MAKRKTKAKRYAVQRHMELAGLISGDETLHYMDIARFLSECNHRLYRQSRVYKAKVSNLGLSSNRKVHVYVLRDTWMLQKAVQLAKDTFDKNMSEEMDIVGSTSRWQDFRMNLAPRNTNITEILPAVRYNNTIGNLYTLNQGEFNTSRVFDEAGNASVFGFRVTGAGDSYSVVEEYDKTANTSDDPSSSAHPSQAAYDGLDADVQPLARDDLQTRGNSPPYNASSLDGDKLFRKVAVLGTSAQGNQKLSTGFFDAPLGLVVLETEGGLSVDDDFYEIEIAAGDYKGVHAETFIEAKKFGHRRG